MSKYSVEGYFCMDKLLKFLQVSFPWFSFGLLDISIDEKDRRRLLSVDSYDEAKKLAIELSKLCKSVCIIEHFVPEKESDQPTPPAEKPESESDEDAEQQALLARPISDLNLSVRPRKCMIRLGISTLGDLVKRSVEDLLKCKNFGMSGVREIREKLALLGLKLKDD